jgi:hypothetical protein
VNIDAGWLIDGGLCVSVAWKTVHVWDAETGEIVAEHALA